jgi:hypothetical protein
VRCARAPSRPPRARNAFVAASALPLCAAVVAGCGGVRAADLFLVERSGSVSGARLTLLVNEEGGVRCNGGPVLKLGDPQLIEARTIQEDLHDPAAKHLALAPGPHSVLSYRAREEAGSVSFSDDSARQPPVFRRLALFVLQTAQKVCRLPL